MPTYTCGCASESPHEHLCCINTESWWRQLLLILKRLQCYCHSFSQLWWAAVLILSRGKGETGEVIWMSCGEPCSSKNQKRHFLFSRLETTSRYISQILPTVPTISPSSLVFKRTFKWRLVTCQSGWWRRQLPKFTSIWLLAAVNFSLLLYFSQPKGFHRDYLH